MSPKQADQLRRAIAKLITARADCDYARAHEPHNADKALEHCDRCFKRLEWMIKKLTDKAE